MSAFARGFESLADPEPIIDDLSRLVAVDTCFPPGHSYARFADLLTEMFTPVTPLVERIVVPEALWQSPGVHGARVNVRCGLPPDDTLHAVPELAVYCHTDTAPVGAGWTRTPLQLSRDGELVYGRGSADMKGAIASLLAALGAIRAFNVALAYRPTLLFCTDEEGGLYPGIRYLAEQGKLSGALLNLNGSAVPRVWAGCFGSLDFRLRFIGRAAHSGEPSGGINAIEQSLPILHALAALQTQVGTRVSSLTPPPGALGPLHARLSITAATGGAKGSALPGEFELIVNRRYCPEENEDQVIGEIRATVARAVALTDLLDHEVKIIGHLPPVTDPDGPATGRWTSAQACGYGIGREQFQRFGSSTSSDFGWVQRCGIQHMMLGGLSRPGRNVHGPDEHTSCADLVGLARSLYCMLAADFESDSAVSVNATDTTQVLPVR